MKFYKMTGLGNDFILINNFDGWLKADPSALAKRLCPRAISVGADGLVVLEPDPEVDFRWLFYNSDGSEAEMCGNAARCAARLAHLLGRAGASLSFRTAAGVLRAEVDGETVKVELTRPHSLAARIELSIDGIEYDAGFANTGVPHAVVFVDDPERVDVTALGRKIRFAEQFKPAGTNAMFVAVRDEHTIRIRSYERGVEDETRACGTGATAAAVVAHLRGLTASPTRLIVNSGQAITIHYQSNPEAADPWPGPVFMEGTATLVYTGEASEEVV